MVESLSAKLLPHQREGAERLVFLLEKFIDGDKNRDDEESYAVFGLLGARGSGKSTTLQRVCDKFLEDEKVLVIKPPLDCTTLAADIPLGLSLASHVKRFLETLSEKSGHQENNPALMHAQEALERTWRSLSEHYVETDSRHRDLQLSLAVTRSEYQTIAANEIESRSKVSSVVRDWVDAALRFFNVVRRAKKSHILISLEDCDLGTVRLSLRVVATFLGELDYDRLMFILVADEKNLEDRFLAGAAEEFSAQMIPQLLAKVVPAHHRVYLDPWDIEARLEFMPLTLRVTGTKESLVDLLNEVLKIEGIRKSGLRLSDIVPLLPQYPRGLTDLYRGLDQVSKPGRKDIPQELILMLARARGDLALARNLTLRPLAWWGLHLRWADTDGTGGGSWNQLVAEALGQGPIWALALFTLPRELATQEDGILWAELFLNLSFRGSSETVGHFTRGFQPLANQLANCSFRFRPTPYELVRLGEEPTEVLDSPWVRWRGENREKAEIDAGWGPLVEWSYGRSSSRLAEILKDLGAPVPSVDRPRASSPILPADIRSLLRLTDTISRLPWGSFVDWAEAQFLASWPALLALWCGHGYLRTLNDCLRTEVLKAPGSSAEPIFILEEMARSLAESALEEESKELLGSKLARLVQAVDQEPLLKQLDHPMADATRAFFDCPAVRHLLPSSPHA